MSVSPTPDADAITPDTSADSAPKIAAFTFPFKPAVFADAKKQGAQYPGSGKSNHDKTPSRAPNGSRRSMGKR